MKNIPIGEVLREYGYITEEQLGEALRLQSEMPGTRLGTLLVEKLCYVTQRQLLEALGQRMGLPLIEISSVKIDRTAVEQIPRQLAAKYHILAIGQKDGMLEVALADPLDFYAIEDIRQVTGNQLSIMLAEKQQIDAAIDGEYAEIEAQRMAQQVSSNISMETTLVPIDDKEKDAPVVKLLNSLLVRGYNTNSSDIHIEPYSDITNVRMRIDGMLIDYIKVPKSLHQSLVVRIKILANLDIAEKRIPQDGHFHINADGCDINLRVSVIPTVHGEKIVLRFLSGNTPIDQASQFGMELQNYNKVRAMLCNPHGIIYITGPTGSGKTTTLYMMLEKIVRGQVNISSIEDPVERNVVGVNQMQVNVLAGLTFETGLRSLLRQDPDIIMVGETRDNETASTSVRAAITGHLVLSTLHTNDAVSTIVRLEDMGVQPYLLASSLVGVIAQRLVKKVCPHCVEEYTIDEATRQQLGLKTSSLRRGHGCHLCNGTGYKGRIAIHEVFPVDRTVRQMINHSANMDDVYDYALEQGMVTLGAEARRLTEAGITTEEELRKITYYNT
ncbi:MAG: ATPase, T2SS/T4P/T4SS family [Angelakisella sp.]